MAKIKATTTEADESASTAELMDPSADAAPEEAAGHAVVCQQRFTPRKGELVGGELAPPLSLTYREDQHGAEKATIRVRSAEYAETLIELGLARRL